MASIRNAQPHEIPKLWELRERSARIGCTSSYSQEQLDTWLGGPLPTKVAALIDAQCVLVAESDGNLAGYGALDPQSHEVEAVFVDPSVSGLGIGRALRQAVEAIALARGISQLRLASTPNAESFYRAAGYVPLQRVEHSVSAGAALSAIIMEKRLCAAV